MFKLLTVLGSLLLVGCIEAPPQSTNNVVSNNTNNSLPVGVGSPCMEDDDCGLGYCIQPGEFGIPGGYCTKFCSSDGTECPAGSHCGFANNAQEEGICLRSCSVPNDCPRDGFDCFDIDVDNNRQSECWPIGNGEGELADPCESTNNCSGERGAVCLSQEQGFVGGYCSKFCSPNSSCGENGECLGGLCYGKVCNGRDGYRESALESEDGELVEFCSREGTAAIGEQCNIPGECAADDAVCIGAFPGGYCSKVCMRDTDCGDSAVCVLIPGSESYCLATCEDSCRDGYFCRPPAFTVDAKMATVCVPRPNVGSNCENAADCAGDNATCLKDEVNFPNGYCSNTCASDNCGRGTHCGLIDGGSCLLSCGPNQNCPQGLECGDVDEDSKKECVPVKR